MIPQILQSQLGCWERAWRMGRDGQRLCNQHHLLKGDLGGRVSVYLRLRDLLFPTHGGERREEKLFQQCFTTN